MLCEIETSRNCAKKSVQRIVIGANVYRIDASQGANRKAMNFEEFERNQGELVQAVRNFKEIQRTGEGRKSR